MTNEEMAERIQNGEKDLTRRLWDQVRRLICFYALRFYRGRRERCDVCGITADDLIQEGYSAFLYALRAYKPDNGYLFTTYLTWPLKNCFNASVGDRGSKSKKYEPLNNCTSLNNPISEDIDLVLMDTVQDKNAGKAFEAVEDAIVSSQWREILNLLPKDVREVIHRRYYGGQAFKQIAKQLGIKFNRAVQLELKGLRKLRHPSNRRRLLAAQDLIDCNYKRSGLQQFRESGYSSVEATYERIEAMRAHGRLEPER